MTEGAVTSRAWPTELVEPFIRDPGGLAIVPLLVWWLVVLGWVATTDRLSRDSVVRNQSSGLWGMLLSFPFIAAALVAWWIPSFLLGLFLMVLAWWAPMLAYANVRNKNASPHETILTVSHMRRLLGDVLGRFGIEVPGGEAEAMALLPQVALAGDPNAPAEEQGRRQQAAAAMPGFADAVRLLADAAHVGAAAVLFDLAGEQVAVRQEVDGVWHPMKAWEWKREKWKRFEQCVVAPPLPRGKADGVRDAILALAGVDPRAVRSRSSGRFALKIDGKPWLGSVATQRSAVAERVLVRMEPQVPPFKSIGDLGLGGAVAEKLMGLLSLENGLIVIASPPSSGCSTSFDRVVHAADRLLRNFVSIEDAASPPREIQNVKPFRFDGRTDVAPVKALELALREYPQVLVSAELKDAALAGALVSRAMAENLVVVGFHGVDAIDCVGRLLALGVDRQKLAASLLGVLSQRLVRKLCPKCRQERPAPPELQVRLRMTAEQLPTIFTASKEGCRLCNGSGYRGRTGVFELAGGETVRQAIAKKADRTVMLKAAMKDGMRPLADAAMRLVADGTTSLEELQRAFKNPSKA